MTGGNVSVTVKLEHNDAFLCFDILTDYFRFCTASTNRMVEMTLLWNDKPSAKKSRVFVICQNLSVMLFIQINTLNKLYYL